LILLNMLILVRTIALRAIASN